MFEETAFKRVIDLFNKYNIPYMLTGGLAVTVWGRTRSTLDIDIVLDIKRMILKSWRARFKKRIFILIKKRWKWHWIKNFLLTP